jgi:hypothetical protein
MSITVSNISAISELNRPPRRESTMNSGVFRTTGLANDNGKTCPMVCHSTRHSIEKLPSRGSVSGGDSFQDTTGCENAISVGGQRGPAYIAAVDRAIVWRNVILPAASAVSAAALTILVGELTRWRRLKEDTRLEHLTSQIRDFYGPIYSMLKARKAVFDSWNQGGPLQIVNDEVRKLFVGQNDAIERLILAKAHLIEVENGRIPEVIGHLGAHAFIWNACIQRFGEVPATLKEAVPEATWPEKFEEYIERTIVELKSELDRRTGFSRSVRATHTASTTDGRES